MKFTLSCVYSVGLKLFAVYTLLVASYFFLRLDIDDTELNIKALQRRIQTRSDAHIAANQILTPLSRSAGISMTSQNANFKHTKALQTRATNTIRRKLINSKKTIRKVRNPPKVNDGRNLTVVVNPFTTLKTFHREVSEQCAEEEQIWRSQRQPGYIVRPCDCYHRNQLAENVTVGLDNLLNLTWEDVNSGLKNLHPGGHWRPSHCAPLRRVAIIIPYRNRGSHLRAFLAHTHPILQKQAVEYQIFVIEQSRPYVFNKGSLMNVGYLEVVRGSGFVPDCLLFHDVDLLAETQTNIAMCRAVPTHFAVFIDKFNYTLLYGKMFGGGVAIKPEQFRAINGYSNQFAGWGGEDDDFYRRVILEHRKIHRPPPEVSRYKMIAHSRDVANPVNLNSTKGYKTSKKSFHDGLSTVRYERVSVDYLPTYTRILVNFPETSGSKDEIQLIRQSALR